MNWSTHKKHNRENAYVEHIPLQHHIVSYQHRHGSNGLFRSLRLMAGGRVNSSSFAASYSTMRSTNSDYVKHTFERLSAAHGAARAKEMIAAVLLEEMYDVLKDKVPFDEPRYKSKLEMLR